MLNSFTRIVQRAVTEFRGFPSLADLDRFMDFVSSGGGDTWSGANVTTTTAMRIAVVWRCMQVRSSAIAQTPTVTYYTDAETGDKQKARDHYLYRTLRTRWNPLTTASRAKRLMQTWLDTYGNAYAYLTIDGRGRATEIWPWHPSRVTVEWKQFNGDVIPFYRFQLDKGDYTAWQPWFNMLHLRGLSTDGFFGLSPIQEHRQTLGMALAIQEHGARFFKNGAALRGLISPKQGVTIKPTDLPEIRSAWHEANGGLPNAHKTAFLPTGLEFQPITVSMEDAQYAESANLTVTDICRIFGVQPHKAFDLTRSTNNNIEHQDIEWRTDTMGDMVVNWEDELNYSLLSERESQTVQIEFLINALMRADATARSNYYKAALAGAPWMTQPEVRRLENMNGDPEENYAVTNNAPGAGPSAEPKAEPIPKTGGV